MISRKPAHLLLVDDDPGLLKLLGMRLTSEGYSVVTAESGQEGLRVLHREKVDLVISDLRRQNDNRHSRLYFLNFCEQLHTIHSGCGGRYPERRIQLFDEADRQRRVI